MTNKFSQFNTLLPYGEKYALYNSLSQKLMFIHPDLKELLQAAINEGIDGLGEYHSDFYFYLLSENYIVADDLDEVQQVKDLSYEVDNKESEYHLTINPTMNCNFKCWYCYESHIKGSKIKSPELAKILSFISKTASKPGMETFILSMFGGEPLLYFNQAIVPIIDHYLIECSKYGLTPHVGFTTNGFLIDDEFINYFKDNNLPCHLQITLDGYGEDHDAVRFVNKQRGSYEQIVANIRQLVQNDLSVTLRVNYTEKNIEKSIKIIDEFKDLSAESKQHLVFDYHRVWQNKSGPNVAEHLERIKKALHKEELLFANNRVNNVHNSCYADKKNSVTINYNGDIYKCTARDFTKANREGFINVDGELIWENGSLETRLDAKFKNKPCLSCRLLPICNGGCSQAALENKNVDYCVYDFDDSKKDEVIRNKVDEIARIEEENLKMSPLVEA